MARVKDNESLNFQIDKLSEAIESMMKGFETLQTPRSLDSDIGRLRPGTLMHLGLTGDDDVSDPESFCKEQDFDPDKIEMYYDRVSMVKEDFRSFELRKAELGYDSEGANPYQTNGILEEICKRVYEQCGIALPFGSINEFIAEIGKITEKSIECSLVDIHGLILRLCEILKQEQIMCSKIRLGDSVLSFTIKERPRKRFQKPDYSANYETWIEKLLQDKDLPDEVKTLCKVKKNLLVTFDQERLKNLDLDSMREELENRLSETELLKKKFTSQLDSLGRFSKQLRQKDIDLLKLREKIDSEYSTLSRDKKSFSEQECKFESKIHFLRSKITEICPDLTSSLELKPRASIDTSSTGRFSPLANQLRNSTPVKPAGVFDQSEELSTLQSELSFLESQSPDSSGTLRMNRLKTQISTIRSSMAISNSLRNSTNSLGRLNNEHKRNASNSSLGEYGVCSSPIPRTGALSPNAPDTSFGAGTSKRNAPRPPGPRKVPTAVVKSKEIPDEIEIIRNQMKVQEGRLKEREQVVEEKENRLQKNWMRLPNSEELLGLVQKELEYLGCLKKEYEEKYEELNNEVMVFAKKNMIIKSKERELETKIIDVGKEKRELEDERRSIEQKFEFVLSLLENL